MNYRLLASLVTALLLAVTASAYNFSISTLHGVSFASGVTSLQFGPDQRLYAAQVSGEILVMTVQRLGPNNYQVTATETINLVRDIPNYNDDGTRATTLTTRQVTGILVVGTASNPVIYVTSSDPRIGGGSGGVNDLNLDTNSGIISRLTRTGGVWSKVDLVRGLPRSEENHASNGMQLDTATNTLYLAQGGNTNAGGPSNNFAFMCETALSAAILSIDLDAINALPVQTDAYGQQYLYNLPTVDDPNPSRGQNPDGSDVNDPFGGNDGLNQARLVADGPVQVYSSGYRNPYDLVITRTPGAEGRMYAWDNGANNGWGGYPQNEGPGGTVTNEYVDGEPGTVNNKDNLHVITAGYYAGHPNPIRANPAGAGWFHYDSTQPAGSEKIFSLTPTTDWPPVPVAMANPVEGDFRQPGVNDGALMTYTASTNGLAEYIATNFSGEMRGNLIAASYDGKLLRIALSADGTTVTNGVEPLASGFGNLPLDVTTPDPINGAAFVGTIWVSHYAPAKISVLEPSDFDSPGSDTCTGINSAAVDEDGDGYSNADEIANDSDPCSAAIRPADVDGDHVSDKLDTDDDNDGVPDTQDPFPTDPLDGKSVPLPLRYDLFNETGIGFFGVGMTGLMMNPGQDYLPLISPDNAIAGGTAGLFTLAEVGPGRALGSSNNQKDAYQFAFNSDEFTTPYIISARLGGPFFNSSPTGQQAQGIYLGNGDQDNYVSVAIHGNEGAGGLQVVYENDGTIVTQQIYPLAGLADLTTVDLYFTVDPVAATVQPGYRLSESDPVTALGSPIAVGGEVLAALMGARPLAIGFFATTGGGGAPTFSATWDYFDIAPVNNTAIAKFTIDPPVTDMATASTYTAGAFKIQNNSTDGQQIESVSIDLSTAIFPDMVFDPAGTAGDPDHKAFQPNTYAGGAAGAVGTNTKPHNGTSSDDGYDGLDITFSAFPPGGSLAFSIDVDPNNVKGVAAPGENHAASVSGLELIGSTVEVFFSDGSVQRSRLGRLENTVDGSYAWLRSDKPPKPGLTALGKSSPFSTGEPETLRVAGPTGFNVTLTRIEGALYLGGVPGGGYDIDPFEANTAIDIAEQTGVIPAAGYLDFTVTGTKSNDDGGYNYVTAVLSDNAGIKGPASNPVVFMFDPSLSPDTQPPTQPGALTFSNVTPNSLTVTWTASTDNVGVTGYRVSRNGSLIATVTGLSYNDSSLAPATTYDYSVVAIDSAGNVSTPRTASVTTLEASASTVVRINCGGPTYLDATGNTWIADTYYNTGFASTDSATVTGTTLGQLFKSYRWDDTPSPELLYTIPIANGSYVVRLYLAETSSSAKAPGKRVFDVDIEGTRAFEDVDVYVMAGGGNKALILEAATTVNDGNVQIKFLHQVFHPRIYAIEVLPTSGPSDTEPPTQPGAITFSGVTSSSVTLDWTGSTDNVGVTGYRISRDGSVLTTVSSLTFTDSTVSPETTYQYSVVALDAAGNASPASTASVTTPAAPPPDDTQPPSQPGVLSFTGVTTSSVTVNWAASTDNVGVAGYRISRNGMELTTVTGLTFTDSTVVANTTYEYSVVAFDAASNDSTARTGSVTTPPSGGASTVIRVNAGGPSYVDGAGHTWSADTGYNTGGTYSVSSSTAIAGTTDDPLFRTERYDASTAPELTYSFTVPNGNYLVRLLFAENYGSAKGVGKRVFDVDIEGARAFEDVDIYTQAGGGNKALILEHTTAVTDGQLNISFVHQVQNPKVNAIEILSVDAPTDTQPPTQPGAITFSDVSWDSVTLDWGASTDDIGVAGYRISRDGTELATVNALTFTDSTVAAQTDYDYTVVALDAAGNESAARNASVTTTAAPDTQPPSAPGALVFSNVTASSLTVSWTAATDNVGVTGYRVSRDGVQLATVTTLSFNDTGLSAATSYSYSVEALDAAGNTSVASTATISTASSGPTLPTIRVNAGGSSYVDTAGNTWSADHGYNTGGKYSVSGSTAIANTNDDPLFHSERYDASTAPELTYSFTVPNGTYVVRLYFAENYASAKGAGLRVFDIDIEGARAFEDVDIYTQAGGGNKAMMLEQTVSVTDGQLNIGFVHQVQNPKINAIEILPAP